MSDEKFSRRSQNWFGQKGKNGFIYRERLRNQGYASDVFVDKPVIGIATTWSELNPCNAHLDRVAEAVKRGVWEAGGFPLEFPAMSLGETLMRPTTMLYRNLLAMEAEELIRANPLDGVVLLAGCDKTPPGLLMGAASVDLPTLMITGGPMLNGRYKGKTLGSGTAIWKYSDEMRSGKITQEEFFAMESCSARSNGSCMTMGTASTMACVTEALGVQLPGSAAIPAVDARRYSTSQEAGRRIVAMVHEDQRLSSILTREAFENAIKVNAAIGGSTNAVVHLLAIAGRIGVDLKLEDFDRLAREVPVLVNLQPSGEFLMEEFFDAGGLPVVMKEIESLLHTNVITVSGKTVAQNIAGAENYRPEVVTPFATPFQKAGSGIVVVSGSLAPNGAVLKVSAATPELMVHTGPAFVFENIDEFHAKKDDPNLAVTKDSVLVLKNAGPKGFPGFPEVGNLAIPKKLLDQGVTDMVRVSDARMSGTAYGTVVLHTSPEAAVGGPLALAQNANGDREEFPTRKDADKKADAIPTRWNDAKVAPDGFLFLNTLTYELAPEAGALYRVHPSDLKLERILSGTTIANGMAWNESADTFYFIDTIPGTIDAFDYRDGEISRRRTMWRASDKSQGLPDGMTIDSEGGLWVAFWSGGCIRRFDTHSNFRITEEIRFPVPHVTSCAFAGDNLQYLIATTAHQGDTENKQSGMTFILEPGVQGTPTLTFDF